MRIFKYQLHIEEARSSTFEHPIPKGAKFLSVQTQHEVPCIWFLVEPSNEEEIRVFEIIGTGIPCAVLSGDIYLGSFQLRGGSFIGHVFDITESVR